MALLGQGFPVWAAVRSEGVALSLQTEFGNRVRTVLFDLTDDDAV